MIIVKQGNSTKFEQGTWCHRLIAIDCARWLNPLFNIQLMKWLDEWMNIKAENKCILENALHNIKPYMDKYKCIEKCIQKRLQNELGGEIEVSCDTGYIDLLTDTEIIEIKYGRDWKHAVGQLLIYSLDYPLHKKRIHLFGIEDNENINKSCQNYNIYISYEPFIKEID